MKTISELAQEERQRDEAEATEEFYRDALAQIEAGAC